MNKPKVFSRIALLILTLAGLFFAEYLRPQPLVANPDQAELLHIRFSPNSENERSWFFAMSDNNYKELGITRLSLFDDPLARNTLLQYLSTCSERRTFVADNQPLASSDVDLMLFIAVVYRGNRELKRIHLGNRNFSVLLLHSSNERENYLREIQDGGQILQHLQSNFR